ncbi:carbohydrate kinase [Pseudoflavonifractor capillosus]|uniref:carbohydrate kinase family protein n=1 Tax=Pseudoflavonifractor capillosus TaxID=106588 RepID=UPI0019560801|nr:carbohydrate kinase [Pseudoflavonifractor capillosus]MBM6897787.1 carbohydrate kinase [Pseudoflavonifractor capillosus]
MRIVTIGEILIDLTQTGVNQQNIPTYAANPGGAPANVAVAAARLGADTAFVGMVGEDGFGTYLAQVLEENGVSTHGLRTAPGATTLAVVSVNGQGERSFQFMRGADARLTPEQVDEELLAQAGILHFGSVSLTADPARSATLHAVERARQQGAVVSYDPNYRAALWDSQENAVAWMRRPLSQVDILKISDEEMELLSGSHDPEVCSRVMADKGISLVLITLGSQGVFYRLGGQTGVVPGVATKVADTNGAGDTFFGAVLSQLSLRPQGVLEGLETAELEDILAFANRAASVTCSRSGAIPAMPTLDELK